MPETDIIANSLGGLSYGGMFIVAFLSNMFIPVPEEIILLVIGYLTGIGSFSYPIIMAIFILGMLISDYMVYSLAYRGSKLVKGLQERMEKRGLLKSKAYIRRHMKKIIFFSRFLVYLRFIGPVVAGSNRVSRKLFLTYDFLALVVYVNIFLGLGNHFHKQIKFVSEGVAKFSNYFMTAVIVILTIVILRFVQKNFLKWMQQIGDYMPTIIPGLEMKESEPELKPTVKKKK